MKQVGLRTARWIFVLMLIVPGSSLLAEDPPAAPGHTARQAQPAATRPVPPALHRALAALPSKPASLGAKAIPTPPPGSWGIVAEGDGGGGICRDSDSEAEVWLGTDGYGLQAFGSEAGGTFTDSDDTSIAYVAWGDYGIAAGGYTAGGYFEDSDNTGWAYVGNWDHGIWATGSVSGGTFHDSDNTGFADIGYGDRGIEAYGSEMGGYFADIDGTGWAYVGYGDRGIEAQGSELGGVFADRDSTGFAFVAHGDRGIEAYGSEMGGYFEDSDGSSSVFVAHGDRGIAAFGSGLGGYFKATDSTGFAFVAHGDRGIAAYGSEFGGYFAHSSEETGFAYVGLDGFGIKAWGSIMGGYFADTMDSAYAYLGYKDCGIEAHGSEMGGYFIDSNAGAYTKVPYDTYKVLGNGGVSFVQNHPYDSSSVIVYAAPEGDEVATYTRGTARLVDGEATVPLGETFKWVTNPDIGLTAHLTPRGKPIPLAVVELSTEEMIVRAPDNAPEGLEFDYLVYGLRIGFEESSIVQEKMQEAYIPSMATHRQLYQRRPDLRGYSALERFEGMSRVADPEAAEPDLSRAHALRDAIIEFDPAVHELPEINGRPGWKKPMSPPAKGEDPALGFDQTLAEGEDDRVEAPAPRSRIGRVDISVDDEGNVYATSFRPSSRDLASLVDVSEQVQPGDVLVIDRDNPGKMRKAFEAHDTGVIGVVASDAGLVLGTRPDDAATPRVSGREIEDPEADDTETGAAPSQRAAVSLAGVVACNVDATYGAVWPGDLLVTSPTPGHAMRADAPLPGTMLGKALEPLPEGVGTISVLVILR
jgi:hypothetical protein